MLKWNSAESGRLLKILGFMLAVCIAGTYLLGKIDADTGENKSAAVSEKAPVRQPVITAVIKDNTGTLDSSDIELLEKYALCYGETLCTLEIGDFSQLFSEKSSEYYQNISAYNVLTGIRKMSHLDLTLESAYVEYTVEQVSVSGNDTTVYIKENNVQKFAHLDDESCSYNINHIFVLTEKNGERYVKKHLQEEDFFLLALEGWDNAISIDDRQRAEKAVSIIIADAQENKETLKISTGNPPENIPVKNTAYNRDAAVEYARQWCNQRNYTGKYLAYDEYGGNCQNFASQCIHAGGIAMDSKGYGETQWKFYSQTLNTKQTPSGRSYSWTGVDPFYTYAVYNRADGLICQADMQLEYAEKGDVIQVGAYGDWRHSLVITDVIKNDDGSLQDIIVASNTADRWNYPLSAYIHTYPRLIHIIGQN